MSLSFLPTVRRTAAPLVLALVMLACDSPTAVLRTPGAAHHDVVVQATLDAEIRALVNAAFPHGQANAVLAHWDQVVRSAATAPHTTLKGKVVPGSSGRSALTRAIDFLQKRSGAATPPAGETRDHLIARLALDMSLYVYGGPATPVPVIEAGADVAYGLILPGTTDTVVTPATQAAVVFPAGAVEEPTVVVITPIDTYYPANCSGPLDTRLCQYPRFYHFNVFPDVKLAAPAKVQVCHVDAGTNRLPLADHDRFRIAHERPASPADYSAGSTIVDNVEVLASTLMDVTNCDANGGTVHTPPPGQIGSRGVIGDFTQRALALARRAGTAAARLVTPRDAYAIDIGVGALTEEFSIFGVVDPLGVADLAQSTPQLGSSFALTGVNHLTGATIATTGWQVRNVGSATSGAFTSTLVIATDTALTSALVTVPLAGTSAVVPGGAWFYPAQSITLPQSVGPGSYFVGTRVTPSGADSTAADDFRSVRITVTSATPAVALPADIAVLPGFSVTPSTVMQGSSLVASGFGVRNEGNVVSSPYILQLLLATDTLLQNVLGGPTLATGTVLTGGTLAPYSASTLPISPCLAPGSYFVGPRVYPGGPDANAANDQISARVFVTAAPAPTAQSAGSTPWTGAGQGGVTVQVQPHCATLSYNSTPSGYQDQQWTYTTTAATTGSYTFNWTYAGLHSWYQSHQALEAWAAGPAGITIVPLVAPSFLNTGNGFNYSGSATLPLVAGYTWGVRPSGGHYDSSQILSGTVQIIDP
jgi:hypothetical protein